MRITSSLLAFIFLSIAAAGIVPEIAARDDPPSSVKGGHGGHHSGVSGNPIPSGTYPPPSVGTPSSHPEHTGMPTQALASHKASGVYPTIVHWKHPVSRRDRPTGFHSHHRQSSSEQPKPTYRV